MCFLTALRTTCQLSQRQVVGRHVDTYRFGNGVCWLSYYALLRRYWNGKVVCQVCISYYYFVIRQFTIRFCFSKFQHQKRMENAWKSIHPNDTQKFLKWKWTCRQITIADIQPCSKDSFKVRISINQIYETWSSIKSRWLNFKIGHRNSSTSNDLGPLLLSWINSNPSMDSNYMPGKVWDEITYPFLNFNGETVEV